MSSCRSNHPRQSDQCLENVAHNPSPRFQWSLWLPVRTPPVSNESFLTSTPRVPECICGPLVLYLAPAWHCGPLFGSPSHRFHLYHLPKVLVAVHSRPENRACCRLPGPGLTHPARPMSSPPWRLQLIRLIRESRRRRW